jgi:hypothetical protein
MADAGVAESLTEHVAGLSYCIADRPILIFVVREANLQGNEHRTPTATGRGVGRCGALCLRRRGALKATCRHGRATAGSLGCTVSFEPDQCCNDAAAAWLPDVAGSRRQARAM